MGRAILLVSVVLAAVLPAYGQSRWPWQRDAQAERPPVRAAVLKWVKVDAAGRLADVPDDQRGKPGIFRQVLVVPAGYTRNDQTTWFADVERMISTMGNLPEAVYTRKYRDRIVYVVAYVPDGGLAAGRANFGARMSKHPTRNDPFPTLRKDLAVQAVKDLQRQMPTLDPIGVMVIFNSDSGGTANAVPPNLLGGSFGIAHLTRLQIHARGDYIPVHELAHAALSFGDEYIEAAAATIAIQEIDIATELLLADGSFRGWLAVARNLLGDRDLRLSESIVDNGFDNTTTTPIPSTVRTEGHARSVFRFEGGMVFGLGTFHDGGDNIMNSDWSPHGRKPPGDRFGWGHSPAQMQVIEQVFDPQNRARRPNDRLRHAGPHLTWLPRFGRTTRVVLFDGDKNHRWHPTTEYEIEVRWPDADGWKSRTIRVKPTPMAVEVNNSLCVRAASLARDALVAVGIRSLPASGGQKLDIGSMTVRQMLDDFLPTSRWPLPYQEVEVPAPVPFRGHHWRFRAHNGTMWSGWTDWTGFYRAL